MMVCHCLRRGGRKNCCKGNWWEGSKECISAAAGFLLSTQKDKWGFFYDTCRRCLDNAWSRKGYGLRCQRIYQDIHNCTVCQWVKINKHKNVKPGNFQASHFKTIHNDLIWPLSETNGMVKHWQGLSRQPSPTCVAECSRNCRWSCSVSEQDLDLHHKQDDREASAALQSVEFVLVDGHKLPLSEAYRGPYRIKEQGSSSYVLEGGNSSSDWVGVNQLKFSILEETKRPPASSLF